MHMRILRNTLRRKHLASGTWQVKSGTVNGHNKLKKITGQVDIQKVVAHATSLELITKTILA